MQEEALLLARQNLGHQARVLRRMLVFLHQAALHSILIRGSLTMAAKSSQYKLKMKRGCFMGMICVSLFFLVAGILFLFWPEEVRDWILKSYVQAGFTKPVLMQKLMFARIYIFSFRVGGGMAIIVGGLLIWLK